MSTKRKTSVLLASLISLLCPSQNVSAENDSIPWLQIIHWLGPIAINFGGKIIVAKLLKEKPPEKTKEEKLEKKLKKVNERYDFYQHKWEENDCNQKPFQKKPKCKKYSQILLDIQKQQENINVELFKIQTDEDYLEV